MVLVFMLVCYSEKPSARGGGAKASQKDVVEQNTEAADHAPSTSTSQSHHPEEPQPVIVEVLAEVSLSS